MSNDSTAHADLNFSLIKTQSIIQLEREHFEKIDFLQDQAPLILLISAAKINLLTIPGSGW